MALAIKIPPTALSVTFEQLCPETPPPVRVYCLADVEEDADAKAPNPEERRIELLRRCMLREGLMGLMRYRSPSRPGSPQSVFAVFEMEDV